MITSFGNKETETLWQTGKSRRMPPDIARRALIKLQILNSAENPDRMGLSPSSHLKKLSGTMRDYWSVRINDRWRLVFRFSDDGASDVMIIDYH